MSKKENARAGSTGKSGRSEDAVSNPDDSTPYPEDQSGMFVKLSIDLRHGDSLRKMKGAPLAVFLAIGLHVNGKGKAWPSVDTLAELTGYKRRSVQYAIRKLESLKIIQVAEGGIDAQGYHHTSRYTIRRFITFGDSRPEELRQPGPQAQNRKPEYAMNRQAPELTLKELGYA